MDVRVGTVKKAECRKIDALDIWGIFVVGGVPQDLQ